MNIIVFTRKYTYNLLTCQVVVIKSVVFLLVLRASIGFFHIALAKEQKLRIKQEYSWDGQTIYFVITLRHRNPFCFKPSKS